MPQHLLPHFNDRPIVAIVDTIVIHSMYDDSGSQPSDITGCLSLLNTNEVSAHYAISRDGELWGLVAEERRAWHSRSREEPRDRMPFDDDSRDQINDFSIGIELVASGPHSDYTDDQYETLLALIASIRTRYPITAIVGHEHIAPGRKSDPGNCFDWHRIIHAHQSSGLRFPAAVLRYRV